MSLRSYYVLDTIRRALVNSPFASSRPRWKPSATHRKWHHFGRSSSLLLHELPAPPGKVDTSHHVSSIRWSGSQMQLPYPESNLGYLSPVSLVVQGLSTPRSKSRTKEPSLPLVSLLDGDALRNVTPPPDTKRTQRRLPAPPPSPGSCRCRS